MHVAIFSIKREQSDNNERSYAFFFFILVVSNIGCINRCGNVVNVSREIADLLVTSKRLTVQIEQTSLVAIA